MTAQRVRAAATALGVTAARAGLLACPVCFQAQDGPVPAGVRAAVVVLVAATAIVLAVSGLFVLRLFRRERCASGLPK